MAARRAIRTSPRAVVAALTLTFAIAGCATSASSTGAGPQKSAATVQPSTTEKATTSTTDAPPTTAAPTTTTTTVEQAIDSKMEVTIIKTQGWTGEYGQSGIRMTWEMQNKAAQPITAFQVLVSVDIVDKLGRRSDFALKFACTDSPLAAGEVRTGHPTGAAGLDYATLDELNVIIADDKACTAAAWPLNRYMEDQMHAQRALTEGAVPVLDVEVVRVVFADGSALGEAVQ